MSPPTDAQLLAACGAQPEAFRTLVERHHEAIHRYAARRVGASEAEDVVAETFATAYRRRDRYDRGRPSAAPWLYGIATNLIRDRGRSEAARLRAFARTGVDPVATAEPAAPDPRGAELARALAALRPAHRDVLFLHAVAELSHEEIAEALDVPVGTVKGWLSRARERARRELGADPDPLPADARAEVTP